MTKPRSKPVGVKERRLARTLLRKEREVEEVTRLPRLCADDTIWKRPSSPKKRSPHMSQSTDRSLRFNVEHNVKPRFWETWLPNAPKPLQEPSSRASATSTSTVTGSPSSIMSSLRAPVVVEMLGREEDGHHDKDADEILMRVIPPTMTTQPFAKIPFNSAEAEFPSRRYSSGGATRFRFAPRLIFPRDIEDAAAFEDEVYTIGDVFEVGDKKVTTDARPDKERRNSGEPTTRQRNTSKGSIHSIKASLTNQVRRSSSESREVTDRKHPTESSEQRSSFGKQTERRVSAGKNGDAPGTDVTEDGTGAADGNGALVNGETGATSDMKTIHVKRKKKHQSIVRIPPITQEQWLSIQHAYNNLWPPPPPVSRAAFARRPRHAVTYPADLPDAFELLQEIQSVERLPDVSESFERITETAKSRNVSRAFLSDARGGGSVGSAESSAVDQRRIALKRLDAPPDGRRQSSHRHSSAVLYYVDPAIKRESLDVYDIPIEEEETGLSEYEMKTAANQKAKQAGSDMKR